MFHTQFDGSSSDALFSGAGFMTSPATQSPDSTTTSAKSRGAQEILPLTVRQIAEAFCSGNDKSNLNIDGFDATMVRLLGLVMNKVERITDVSFTLDDGTGRIDVIRRVNEVSDANEVTAIQNGMYVKVTMHLKGFQVKRHAFALSVQHVPYLNDIVLHFVECIYVHLESTRQKIMTFREVQGGVPSQIRTIPIMSLPFPNGKQGYQDPLNNPFSAHPNVDDSGNDVLNLVLGVLQDPAIVSHEHGMHVDELGRRVGIPKNRIMDAINYHVDMGHIYSTIDEHHFKCACND